MDSVWGTLLWTFILTLVVGLPLGLVYQWWENGKGKEKAWCQAREREARQKEEKEWTRIRKAEQQVRKRELAVEERERKERDGAVHASRLAKTGRDDGAVRYLNAVEALERIGAKEVGLEGDSLPEPDALIGRTRGWLPSTIDEWNANRSERGGRPRERTNGGDEKPRKG